MLSHPRDRYKKTFLQSKHALGWDLSIEIAEWPKKVDSRRWCRFGFSPVSCGTNQLLISSIAWGFLEKIFPAKIYFCHPENIKSLMAWLREELNSWLVELFQEQPLATKCRSGSLFPDENLCTGKQKSELDFSKCFFLACTLNNKRKWNFGSKGNWLEMLNILITSSTSFFGVSKLNVSCAQAESQKDEPSQFRFVSLPKAAKM